MTEESRTFNAKKIVLMRGDITRQQVDAIVNAANSGLLGGGGVDGAIHRAGGASILEECKQIRQALGTCPPGQAVITGGGKLAARYVIHAVGPIWRNGSGNEADTLASAYLVSLSLAAEYELQSIAFPSISTGAYGYPVDQAAKVAIETVTEFCRQESSLREIRFVLFDQFTFGAYSDALNEASRTKNRADGLPS